MENLALIIGSLVVIGIFFVVLQRLSRTSRLVQELRDQQGKDQTALLIKEDLKAIHERLDRQTQTVQQSIQSQLGESRKIVENVTERLTKLDETNRQVMTFADQLNRLQDILKNPKQRGVFGEYYLEKLLAQAFQPQQYEMQYKFRDGIIVDAILRFGDKIIPIDSKFSLENYNRIVEETDANEREKLETLFKQNLKLRIDETSKYIRPSEGTVEFAFMFIPAEGIYYDLLVNKVGAMKVNTRDLIDYAVHEKKVHIVSPTTFYVTLQALMVGMRAYTIQESTKQIIQNVGVLGKHLRAYDDYFRKLGGHLGTTVGAYNQASRELAKVDKDIMKLGGGEKTIEANLLERPTLEE